MITEVKKNPPFKTRQGWWYISETRKHGRNKYWAGPFPTEDEAKQNQDLMEK